MKSRQALRAKRLTNAFFAKADHWAGVNKTKNPHWLKNVRLYQDFACKAMNERSQLLRDYLARRATRIAT